MLLTRPGASRAWQAEVCPRWGQAGRSVTEGGRSLDPLSGSRLSLVRRGMPSVVPGKPLSSRTTPVVRNVSPTLQPSWVRTAQPWYQGVCTALGTMVAVARSGASRLQAAARRDDGGALRTGGLHPIAYRTLGGEGKVGRSSALAMCVQGHDLLWPSHASGALRIP
jgi:hypothetical protein